MKIILMASALTFGTTAIAQSSEPARDARGIAVVSDQASAPSGANQAVTVQPGAQAVPAPNQSAVFSTQASTKTYPPCTRNQTDGCVQTYERGRTR
jgi:hypothetical protein